MKIRPLVPVLVALALAVPIMAMFASPAYDHRYDALAAGDGIALQANLDKDLEATVHSYEVWNAAQTTLLRYSRGGGLTTPEGTLPFHSLPSSKLFLSVHEVRGPSVAPSRRRFLLKATVTIPILRTGKPNVFYHHEGEVEVDGKNDPLTMAVRRQNASVGMTGDPDVSKALEKGLPEILDEFSGQLGEARAAQGYGGRTSSRLGEVFQKVSRWLGFDRGN